MEEVGYILFYKVFELSLFNNGGSATQTRLALLKYAPNPLNVNVVININVRLNMSFSGHKKSEPKGSL